MHAHGGMQPCLTLWRTSAMQSPRDQAAASTGIHMYSAQIPGTPPLRQCNMLVPTTAVCSWSNPCMKQFAGAVIHTDAEMMRRCSAA
eukprot:CAMPEP_0171192280 /NCGR_PEP_ID=MMETSP0790-20130122/19791_1 /TAXON_ID=2925 /ORGANISM="Alexandrium catenella, Strain OF101" /LENGTH=86 /DNA_ID=CAMNT_0011657439 /DNA_START=33 /DNA_END=289 /DNA_ORIENTATION=-